MLLRHLIKSKKTHFFLAGVATTLVAPVVAKAPCLRKAVVKTMAKGMELQKQAQISYENMKEEAADLVYEAKMKAEDEKIKTACEACNQNAE